MKHVLAASTAIVLLGVAVSTASAPGAAGQRKLRPKLGVAVVVSPLAGRVLVKQKGANTFAVLRMPRVLPVDSIVDTTRGTVNLTSAADSSGTKTQTAEFDGGAFVVKQGRAALTDLFLVGGSPMISVCKGSTRRARQARTLPAGTIRLLHGRGHGHFRTVGSYAAATVHGTDWLTEDRCSGTFVGSNQGTVVTQSGGRNQNLDPGQSLLAYCFPSSPKLELRDYCLFVLSQPAVGAFGFGFSTFRSISTYNLCIHAPSGMERCRQFSLMPPNQQGVRISAVSCDQDEGAGGYSVRFVVGGKQLGPSLPFTATIPPPTTTPMCSAFS